MGEHPDLPDEQAYISYSYDCLEGMIQRASEIDPESAADPVTAEIIRTNLEDRVADLADERSALVFGRIDFKSNETYYIGRIGVKDPSTDERVVINWRTPVAEAFYQAHRLDPRGLTRRRQFACEGRRLLSISDDVFEEMLVATEQPSSTGSEIRGADALLADLARARTGEMRDIVSTIQAEQDRLIRSALEGVLVIQGGPGTGKTAVGLHRAALLLFQHREILARRGVLIVGPNRAFMRYISRVLPSMGEYSVDQRAIGELGQRVRIGRRDSAQARRIKGDPRMAEVIRRALRNRVRSIDREEQLSNEGITVTITPEETVRVLADIPDTVAHAAGRDRLRALLLDLIHNKAREQSRPGRTAVDAYETFVRSLAAAPQFQSLLDRMWPTMSAQELVSDLLAGPRRMTRAAEGVLTKEEQESILREPSQNLAEERWARSDIPLLDEAEYILRGRGRTYGYLVVDEAQDLSPMELRMLARRCPTGAMTVLGDLAQGTSSWAHDAWDEILDHLPTPKGSRVEELSIGYRVPQEVMALAGRLLPIAAPDINAPDAIRQSGEEPIIKRVQTEEVIERSLSLVRQFASDSSSVGLIVPKSLYAAASTALGATDLQFGEAQQGELAQPIVLVLPPYAKGLEFDATVVVEPTRILEEEAQGARSLYVCMTRTTHHLGVVHSLDLPEVLQGRPTERPTPRPPRLRRENTRPLLVRLFFEGKCLHDRLLRECNTCSALLETYGLNEVETILRSELCFHLRAAESCVACGELMRSHGDEIYSAVEQSDVLRLTRVADVISGTPPTTTEIAQPTTLDLPVEEETLTEDVLEHADEPVSASQSIDQTPDATEGGTEHIDVLDKLIVELTTQRRALLAGLTIEDLRLPRLEPPEETRAALESTFGTWPAILDVEANGNVRGLEDSSHPDHDFLSQVVREALRVQPSGGRVWISATGAFTASDDRKFVTFVPPLT